jgi:hypothetical protein
MCRPAFMAGAAFSLREGIGPGRAWVIARLDIDNDLHGGQVKSLVRGIESGMKRESEAIYRVDVVPIGRAQAVAH